MMDTLCKDLQQEGLGVKFEDFKMKIDITNQYTYLGEIIDSKCRMMPHLEEKKNKMLWLTKRITGIMKEEVYVLENKTGNKSRPL